MLKLLGNQTLTAKDLLYLMQQFISLELSRKAHYSTLI